MTRAKDKVIVQEYIQRVEAIRKLSSPSILEIKDAEEFCTLLRENFEQIGILAEENYKMLERILYPRLGEENPLSKDETEFLDYLSEQLVDAFSMESLDVMLEMRISEKLLANSLNNEDLSKLIRQLDTEFTAAYTLMSMTKRISFCSDLCEKYRDRGLEAGNRLLHYLSRDEFLKLPDSESRKLVLVYSRYLTALYEDLSDRKMCEENLRLLRQSLMFAEDSFYREAAPDYDWNYHLLRTYEYFLMLPELNNSRGFRPEQCAEILEMSKKLEELWLQNPEENCSTITWQEYLFFKCRAEYAAGSIDRETYKQKLCSVYNDRNQREYDLGSIIMNIQIPVEYLCIMDPSHMSEKEKATLDSLYNNTLQYIHCIPNAASLTYVLEYITQLLERFIEIPGGISFEEMCLNCLGALHPPSYIHSIMVGKITRCLCDHLLQISPELFLGLPGIGSLASVRKNRGKLLDFAYHAAVCHDFGKIPIIDTIFVYGRKLMEEEFNIIKQHPVMGAYWLDKNESTREYSDIALLHHRWHNEEGGYPLSQLLRKQKHQLFIDLVSCADCLDAATDRIGRSYNIGKSLSDFIKELEAGSGTRYAPFLTDLLREEDVQKDLSYLLSEGRLQTYKNTYVFLKDVQEHRGMRMV